MENVKHIKNITIENFKCFEFLSVENFEQFNIILGDNNVGKTSFLEMLLFDENISQSIHNFQSLLFFRKIFNDNEYYNINPFPFFVNKFSNYNRIKVKGNFFNNRVFEFSYEGINTEDLAISERNKLSDFFNILSSMEKEILKVKTNIGIEYRRFWISENFEQYNLFLPFVYSTAYYDQDLIGFYSNNFTKNRDDKKKLINFFKFLISGLIEIEITLDNKKNAIIGFWISKDGNESLIPLALFGDGTIRFFRLIMEIIMCKNGYICIDEIDTGIHYSKFKDFIRVILLIANENKVQLFITTHNNEFLKAFKEVLEEIEFKKFQDETKCFSLKKLPKGETKAYSYNFDEFEFAIEQENELR